MLRMAFLISPAGNLFHSLISLNKVRLQKPSKGPCLLHDLERMIAAGICSAVQSQLPAQTSFRPALIHPCSNHLFFFQAFNPISRLGLCSKLHKLFKAFLKHGNFETAAHCIRAVACQDDGHHSSSIPVLYVPMLGLWLMMPLIRQLGPFPSSPGHVHLLLLSLDE